MKISWFMFALPFVFLGVLLQVGAQPEQDDFVDKRRISACEDDCLAGRCYFRDCQGKYIINNNLFSFFT